MRQSKAQQRAQLQELLAEGEVHKDASRITVVCDHCRARRYVPVRYLAQFGVTCPRCGGRLRI